MSFNVDDDDGSKSSSSSDSEEDDDILQDYRTELDDEDEETLDQLNKWIQGANLEPNDLTISTILSSLNLLLEVARGTLQKHLNSLERRLSASKFEYGRLLTKGCTPSDKFSHFLYAMPYFRDRQRFVPSKNDDAIAIRKQGLPDMLLMPKVEWSAEEIGLLEHGIKLQMKKSIITKIVDEMRLIIEKVQVLEAAQRAGADHDADSELKVQVLKKHLEDGKKQLAEVKAERGLLQSAYEDQGSVDMVEWDVVSHIVTQNQKKRYITKRTPDECRQAWLYAYAPWINKSAWTKEELERLYEIGTELEWRRWNEIAFKLGTSRTAWDCAQAYLKNEEAQKCDRRWTSSEDQLLLSQVKELRKGDYVPWKVVAMFFDNRSSCNCRMRYEVLKKRRGRWTPEEDELLLKAVKLYGEHAWTRVASKVPGRSLAQCRTRYVDSFRTKLRVNKWSSLEDDVLLLGVKMFGTKWVTLANLLFGRTANQVKMRHRAITKKRKKTTLKTYEKQVEARLELVKKCSKSREALKRKLMVDESDSLDADDDFLSQPSVQQFINSLEKGVREELCARLDELKQRHASREWSPVVEVDKALEQGSPVKKRRGRTRQRITQSSTDSESYNEEEENDTDST